MLALQIFISNFPRSRRPQRAAHQCFAVIAFAFILCFPAPFTLSQTRKPVNRPITTVQRDPVSPPPEKTESKTFGLTVERYTNNIVVEKDGTSTQTWDATYRIKSALALASFKRVQRVYNGDLEDIDVSDVYILKPDGKKIPVALAAIEKKRTAQSEAAPAFSSLMMVEIRFDNVEIGDAIHYVFKVTARKTHFEGQFDKADYLFGVFDWDSAEINLTAPLDYPIYTQSVDLDGGRIADENGKARWQWRKIGLKAMEPELMMMDAVGSGPRVVMTSFKDYDALGRAYWKEASKRTAVTTEIKAMAEEITWGLKTAVEQAAAIYQWVNKNIRYLSIVVDRNGWIPHDASQILANRYGDCKDYSTILNAMLKAKGIESYPVIIRADLGNWFPSVATPAYFNHAILYIPGLDVFADATAPNTRLGLITEMIVGKKAFLAGEKTGVIETPSNRPDDNDLSSDITIDLGRDGSINAKSVNTYKGRSEILFRPIFGEIGSGSGMFVTMMLSYYGMQGTGKILKVSNPFKVAEPFEVEIEVKVPKYTTFTKIGSFRIPLAMNLTNTMSIADIVKPETRRTDLLLGAVRIRETYHLKFPAGVILDPLPPVVEFTNPIGKFRNKFTPAENGVKVTREVVINKDNISSAEYAQARDLLTKASTAFQTEIKYHASRDLLLAKASAPVAQPKASLLLSEIRENGYSSFTTITPIAAKRLEATTATDPTDPDSRIRLVLYYSGFRNGRAVAGDASFLRHRLWLIENRPDISDTDLFIGSYARFKAASPEYAALKTAWLRKVEKSPADIRIRTNAFEFIKLYDRTLAASIIREAETLDPDNYELPLMVQKMYASAPADTVIEPEPQRLERLRNELNSGKIALSVLKKERSDDRNSKRRYLLQDLADTAFELKDYDGAKALATELILDFGQSANESGYDNATHLGNIILGRVALRQNDVAKAKEYLLIAIRAPLRKRASWLENINTSLAKELFAAGEKDTVLEYLHLCESLSNLTTEKVLFAEQLTLLKRWQVEITQGKTPSFDFYKPTK